MVRDSDTCFYARCLILVYSVPVINACVPYSASKSSVCVHLHAHARYLILVSVFPMDFGLLVYVMLQVCAVYQCFS